MTDLIGTTEAAALANTTTMTIRRAFRAGEFKGKIIGSQLRIERKEILKWAANKKQISAKFGVKKGKLWADFKGGE